MSSQKQTFDRRERVDMGNLGMDAEHRTRRRISLLFVLSLLPVALVALLSRVLSPAPDRWQTVMSLICDVLWGLWGMVWTLVLLKITFAQRAHTQRWPALSLTVLAAVSGTIYALTEVPWLVAGSSIELRGVAVSVKITTSYVMFAAVGVLFLCGVFWYVRKRLREKGVER